MGTGFFVLYFNKERLEVELIKENSSEIKVEIKRKSEFDRKFKKLSRLNIEYNIIYNWQEKKYLKFLFRILISPFILIIKLPYILGKWIYKTGWWYSIITITLLILGFGFRIYHLGHLSLWWDELNTGTYVTRILETGTPLFPSGLGYYWRGVAYHYFVSLFTFLFGNTEFWIRFPSVLFGMGIIILIFYYAKKVDKKTALFILLFLVLSSYNIEYSRFARFYIMNTFLFILAIIVFYKGFFDNKIKYKIASVLLFFIMMHTVQTGAIFLSLIVAWGFFLIIDFYEFKKYKLSFLRGKVQDFIFMIVFLIIFYLDNIFYSLFKINVPYKTALELGLAPEPQTWSYISMPQWKLFSFFNENYLPLILILLSLMVIFFLFTINREQKSKLFIFTGLTLFFGILLWEIGSRNVFGPRIYLFAEALLVLISLTSLFLILKICFKDNINAYIILGLITILLILNIHPSFYERITINYGDDVSNDPFRTTNVAAYRADYKTTNEYVFEHKSKQDIIISVISSDYFYLKSNADYILNQNYRWNTDSVIDEKGNYVYLESFSININSANNISQIINQNPNKKIWLIVNGGSVNILSTIHIRQDFIEFLEQNKDKVVYTSPDGWSEVLLFNN
jgi:4-amino-4-deoxy-L-arabinose transferase-like glycosyltransferase